MNAASPLDAAHGLTSKLAGVVALEVNPHGRKSLVSTTMNQDCSAFGPRARHGGNLDEYVIGPSRGLRHMPEASMG